MSVTMFENDVRRAVGWGAALAVLWFVVVILRSETTLHLAPFLVAGTPPVLNALDGAAAPDRRSVVIAAGAGLVISVATAAILIVSGNLDGPAIEPFGSVLVETLVLAVTGAAVGLLIGLVRVRN